MQTTDMFSCQKWMLSWSYRRQNLLAELVAYNADILCLQVKHCDLAVESRVWEMPWVYSE